MPFDFAEFTPVTGHPQMEKFLEALGMLVTYDCYKLFRRMVNEAIRSLNLRIAPIPSYKQLNPTAACYICGANSGKPGDPAPAEVHAAHAKLPAKVRRQNPLSSANAEKLAEIFIAGIS